MTRAMRRVVLSALALALVSGCGDGGARDPGAEPSDPAASSATPSADPAGSVSPSASADHAATAPVDEEWALIVAFTDDSDQHDDAGARAELMETVANRLDLSVSELDPLALPGNFLYAVEGVEVEADLAEIIDALEKLDEVDYAVPNGRVYSH